MNDGCLFHFLFFFALGPSSKSRNPEPGRNFVSIFGSPSSSRTASTDCVTLAQAERERETLLDTAKGVGRRVRWWWCVLIGQKGLRVGILLPLFFVFPLLPVPSCCVDHGRASPYHAMLCMQNARSDGRGEGSGSSCGVVGKGTYSTYLTLVPLRKEPLTHHRSNNNNNNARSSGGGSKPTLRARGVWGQEGRKKVTVRATPVPGRAPASGMVISLLLCARVGCAWVRVPMYLCAPVFPCVGVDSWGGACSAGLLAGGRAGGQEGIPLPGCGAVLRWCGAVLCCAVPRGRDPGPRWHGVAWPMEVEVGIFSLAWMGMESWEGTLADEGH